MIYLYHNERIGTYFSKKMILFLLFLSVFMSIQAQSQRITLPEKRMSILQAFERVEKQTNLTIAYNEANLNVNHIISVKVKKMPLSEAMSHILKNTNTTFHIKGMQIIIVPASVSRAKVKIRGTVTDRTGESIIGANIVEKGTTNGTLTDLDGKFQLQVSPRSVLVVSYIGYITQEIVIGDKSNLNITLSERTQELEDVVVVGYSTRTREKLISSVSTISNTELTKASVPNLESALTGRATGLFSRQTNGEPGYEQINLQIRGFGSPLIVVDGIPGRSFSQMDPSEIESISVLKDASAAAVYGMQGANGVVLVTTKRGKRGEKTEIDISTRYGLQMPHNYQDAANTTLWQTLVNEYNANLKLISDRNAVVSQNEMAIRDYPYNTNWRDEMIQNAPISQSNISIKGGTEKVSFFISGGFLWQKGIWATDAISKKRFNLRSNLDVDITRNLSLSVGVGAIIDNLDYPSRGATEIAASLKNTAPNIPVHWEAYPDYYAYNGEGSSNPMALADKSATGYSKGKNKSMNIDFSVKYSVPFIKGLSLKANLGYSSYDAWSKNWYKNIVYVGHRATADEYYYSTSESETNKASLSLGDSNNYSITAQGFISYLNSFDNHNINSGLVFELLQDKNRSTSTGRGEFPSTILDMMAGGISNKLVSNGESLREHRASSIIGRFSYDYSSKYFVDFNFRYDGAQYFADKWGFFPSTSIGWMVTNESFMASLKPIINELKIRASWGVLGDLSAAKNYYDSYEQYYHQSGYLYPGDVMTYGDRTIYGLKQTVNANPAFTWSKSTMINVGIDFKLWNGLLGGSAEIFRRTRKDLPAQKANDNAGDLATWYNLNEDNTRGFEVSIQHENRISDFNYQLSGNVSWSRTQNGYVEHGQFTSGYNYWKWYSGNRWSNVRWGLHQTGHYQNYDEIAQAPMHENSNNNSVILPGDLKYEDWNGDGYIDEYDKRPIGRSSYPELIFGINLSAQWKGFDINMFWQGGALANFLISTYDMDAFKEGQTYNNAWAYFEDRWHKADYTDPNSQWIPGHFPAIRDFTTQTINRQTSDYWMWNGNYIRLKNLELGYTLPGNITRKAGIKQLRIYANIYNFLTFSSQKYFDPEQAETTYSFASYPQIKSFNIGVNLKF